jgi:hypothetical protein
MSKDRNRGNREAKKPKAEKKAPAAASTFLRPQPVGSTPTVKESRKPSG